MFEKVLVANRGEIAVRIMRTCRALGIATVAVYSDADRDALHVRQADEAVRIGPARAAESYLCLPSIIDAARRTGVGALQPGYGFLAENPTQAEACEAAGITFIGPPAAAMRVMGDKEAARRLATELGVPVLPGLAVASEDDESLLDRAGELGFPLMVKAVGGGGGRGMRLVRSPDALLEALAAARREAGAAFGDERLLLERAVLGGRHVEVQVLVDTSGQAVHLGERDCSIQRRHQKVIEESPSPAVTPKLRKRMSAAALEVARAAGYVNAGTVEFLLDGDGQWYFLEMNTRLQVEHGVTELVTGLDLVECQLRIAGGEPLPITQDDIHLSGHAIECRIYAEDPARGYLPSGGRVTYFRPPEGAGIRNDIGVEAGVDVPIEYDPLLAKLLVHAPSREGALERCARALDAYAIDGVATNLGLLQAVIGHLGFAAGTADLDTLEGMAAAEFVPRLPPEVLLAAAASDLARPGESRALDAWEALGAWRVDGRRPLEYTYHGRTFAVEAVRLISRTDGWRAKIGDNEHTFAVSRVAADELLVSEAGTERRWTVARDGAHLIVESEGRRYVLGRPGRSSSGISLSAAAGLSGTLRAPMPGVVVRVLVAEGDRVVARQPLVLLEAMKMEHILESSVDGVVTKIACRAGQKVAEGDVLIELESGGAGWNGSPAP
jgi:acetyl-CoA carboxylase biotin carboxylase subunit